MARKRKRKRDNHLNADRTQKLLAETLHMQARTLALLEYGERRRKRSRSHSRADDATTPRAGVARRRAVLTPRSHCGTVTESSPPPQHFLPIPPPPSMLPVPPPPPHEFPPPPPPWCSPAAPRVPCVQETDEAKPRARLSARQGAGEVEEPGATCLQYMDDRFVRLMTETLSAMKQRQHVSV